MTELAVIMSIYKNDRLEFVRQAVQSILEQTFSEFHYYIIFDGPVSSEVDSYISSLTDIRIRHFRLDRNGGLANALNVLLEIILKNKEYSLIARMDADDISMPSRFEKQYSFLSENPDISCIGSWYEEIDEAGGHLSYKKLPVDHEGLRRRYLTRTPFAHPSVMYRRSLIENAGYYPEDALLMEDNVLWGRSLKIGLRFANIPEYLLKFRIDKGFFRRRSGLKYGWQYITTRFRTNRMLSLPFYGYFISFGVGFLKMFPGILHKKLYQILK